MGLSDFLNKLRPGRKGADGGKDAMSTIRNWYTDRYESAIIQRNIMFLVLVVSLAIIGLSVSALRYIKNSKSIEPFVIEIEPKAGVPTVVDPVTIKAYSANDAIRRYFVLQYVKAREEYYADTYNYNYNTVVRVFSTEEVYYRDYRPQYGTNNPSSPVNLYGKFGYRQVLLKSIVFLSEKTAQVRFALQIGGVATPLQQDRVALITFNFENIKMSDDERLINPLGFRVTLYKVEDERVQ